MKLPDQSSFLRTFLNPAMGKLSHFFQEIKTHENILQVWRARIFLTIFSSTILIGALSYVPNMRISFRSGDWLSISIYTIVYSTVISISFAVLSSLLLGLRAGLIALFLNICTIFLLAVFLNTGYLTTTSISYSPSEYWLATGLTFVFLSTVITISIGVLVAALEKNLQKQQSLTRKLKSSNEQLEQENEERRSAEESLQKSQERYKTLTNNLSIGIYRNTAGPEGRFLEANPAIVKMFGYESKNEFLDIKVSDLYKNPEERKSFNEKMLQKGFGKNDELLLRKKNGGSIICSVSAVAIKDEKGEVKYYDGAIEDITERKHLELQFQQAQKMKAVGTLAGGVAHDLNNILSGIVSYPELILMDLPEDSSLRKPIKRIQESGQRAAAIVEDLLTLARRGVSTAEIMNLNDLISEYLLSPEFEKLKTFHPSMEIETHLDSSLLNLMGSPVHLSKTVMNLVSNAAEAMVEGGKVSLSTENKYIDRPISGYHDVEEGDYVVLTVSDSGIGIAAEEIDRIFEPFYTKKVMGRSGTGLGMAVVWGTVKDHKGYIHIESEIEKGTTFKLYFPITRKEKPVDQKSKESFDYMGSGESILVVDDVKEQREIASKILSQLGYSVKTVSSGEDAVNFISKETVDLIVLDMIMSPGIDGLETYERIISIHPNQKAIIASGFSETNRVKKAQKLGTGTYVRKPYTIEKIGIAVKSELEKEKKAA